MVLWTACYFKGFKKLPFVIPLLFFMVSYLISAFSHVSYAGLTENIKGTVWLILPIILVYGSAGVLDKADYIKKSKWLEAVYIFIVSVMNLVSLSMIYWGQEFDYEDPQGEVHAIGYRWGRLWGVYDDPNYGGMISVVAVLLALFLLYHATKLVKGLAIASLLINTAYVGLSDSRTALISLLAAYVFTGGYMIWLGGKKGIRRAVIVIVMYFAALAYMSVVTFGYWELEPIFEEMASKNESAKEKADNLKKAKENAKKREEDKEEDSSNGRLSIWMSGLELVEKNPVFGIGYRNIQPYVQEECPDSYLANSTTGTAYDSMHNLELDIAVSQGFVGLLFFVVILLALVIRLIHLKGSIPAEDVPEVTAKAATVIAIGAGSTFISLLLYVNTPVNFMFWLLLGTLSKYFMSGSKSEL